MTEQELLDKVKELEERIEKLEREMKTKAYSGHKHVPRIDAIGKPFPKRGEPIIPTVGGE